MEQSVKQVSRRKFIASTAVAAATTVFLGANTALAEKISRAFAKVEANKAIGADPLHEAQNIIHTTCLGCHSHCVVKAKIQDGVLVKLDGSPYASNGRLPHLPYTTALGDEATQDGKMCLKGHPRAVRSVSHHEGAQARGQARREQVGHDVVRSSDGRNR
jgi:anaerobic selenocysteine-containing dehydrogenase